MVSCLFFCFKERARNNFPIYVTRDGAVVPLGQEVVEEDFHVLFESLGTLAAGVVDLVENVHGHLQAGAGGGLFHQALDDLDRVEDHALAGAGHMREQAVLDGVVLGTVRRVVGHADFQPQTLSQLLQFLLEHMTAGAVGAAAIAQEQQPPGLRILLAALGGPPPFEAVTGEFAGLMTVPRLMGS